MAEVNRQYDEQLDGGVSYGSSNRIAGRKGAIMKKLLGILTLSGLGIGAATLHRHDAALSHGENKKSVFGLSDEEFGKQYVAQEQHANSPERRVDAWLLRCDEALEDLVMSYNALQDGEQNSEEEKKRFTSEAIIAITTIIDAANMVEDGRSPLVLEKAEELASALRIVVSSPDISVEAKADIGDLTDVNEALGRLRTKMAKLPHSAADGLVVPEHQQVRMPSFEEIQKQTLIEDFFRNHREKEVVSEGLATIENSAAE